MNEEAEGSLTDSVASLPVGRRSAPGARKRPLIAIAAAFAAAAVIGSLLVLGSGTKGHPEHATATSRPGGGATPPTAVPSTEPPTPEAALIARVPSSYRGTCRTLADPDKRTDFRTVPAITCDPNSALTVFIYQLPDPTSMNNEYRSVVEANNLASATCDPNNNATFKAASSYSTGSSVRGKALCYVGADNAARMEWTDDALNIYGSIATDDRRGRPPAGVPVLGRQRHPAQVADRPFAAGLAAGLTVPARIQAALFAAAAFERPRPRSHVLMVRSSGSRPDRWADSPGRPNPRDRRAGTGSRRRGRCEQRCDSGCRAGGRAPHPPVATCTSSKAFQMPTAVRFDLGAVARWTTAWARLSWASGKPTNSTARAAASATTSAIGSAMPTSSLARITRRRAMKRASSPAASMRASQYRPASGSEPRMLLMKALITS